MNGLVGYCARPACRRELRQDEPGPAYCNDDCERAARADWDRLNARLEHLNALAEQTRIDLARHDGVGNVEPITETIFSSALARAQGALPFLPADDPVVRLLRNLTEAAEAYLDRE